MKSVAFCCLALAASTSQAVVLDIDARTATPASPVVANLTAGVYRVEPVSVAQGGTFDAWNAWNGEVSGTAEDGSARKGWLRATLVKTDFFNWRPLNASDLGASGLPAWTTPELALQHTPSTILGMINAGVISVMADDVTFDDNVGGESLKLTRVGPVGDIDADGSATFNDLLILAQHYGAATNRGWEDGDFDYTGSVDFNDLLTLAQHYGSSGVVEDAPLSALPGAVAEAWLQARSSVPEPASLTAIVFSAVATRRRADGPRRSAKH